VVAREFELSGHVEFSSAIIDLRVSKRRNVGVKTYLKRNVAPNNACPVYLPYVRDLIAGPLFTEEARQSRKLVQERRIVRSELFDDMCFRIFEHPANRDSDSP
jgi:hypothetical protein